MSSNEQAEETDSRVEDRFGQSVERDAELADELSKERPEDDPDSPGATIDDAEPAEPNEPG